MFPLIRQRFEFAAACICMTLLLLIASQVAFGQEPEEDTPAQVDLPVDDWKPPTWYIAPEQRRAVHTEIMTTQGLKSQNPTPQLRGELQRMGQYWLSQVAWPENRSDIPRKVTHRFLSALLSINNRPGGRAVLMDEMIDRAPDLLNHPSDVVRTNLVLMLSQFSIEPANFQDGSPAVPYNPAYKILLNVVQDKNQDLDARIAAALGLVRFCRDGKNTPNINERAQIGVALVQALQATPADTDDGISWFRQRMIEALGYAGRIDDLGGKPVMLNELMSIVRNKKETWNNRAEACLAISHLELNGQVNLPLITHEICTFLQAMLDSKAFASAPGDNLWNRAFTRVYLSFRPRDQREVDLKYGLLNQINRQGLGGNRAYVEGAFANTFPILDAILSNSDGKPKVGQKAMIDFTGWLGTNIPTDRRLLPTEAPID